MRSPGIDTERVIQSPEAGYEPYSEGLDVILAADVLIYVGALERVFEGAAASLRRNGGPALFLFSLESLLSAELGTKYRLQRSGRFAHSRAYVDSLCEAYGFTILRCEDVTVRLETTERIPGWVYICRLSTL